MTTPADTPETEAARHGWPPGLCWKAETLRTEALDAARQVKDPRQRGELLLGMLRGDELPDEAEPVQVLGEAESAARQIAEPRFRARALLDVADYFDGCEWPCEFLAENDGPAVL